MKNLKKLTLVVLSIITFLACETNESEDTNTNNTTTSVTKNTLSTANSSGSLNFYSYTSYSLSNGTIYDVVVSEKKITSQSRDLGTYVRLFIKELPSQNTTFNHRQDANFDVATGQYFFNNARIGASGSQEWYAPFVNARTTADLNVTVENDGVATFTVVDAELSDNFVTPITTTDKFTLSFSINVSELTASNVTAQTDLAQ